jgi:FMN phosphatase YigB (HAD superfamily)
LIVFDLDDTLFHTSGQIKYENRWEDVKNITPFAGVPEFLRSFPAKKVLLTWETDKGLQDAKIDQLGIRTFFNEIVICYSNQEKKECLARIKEKYSPENIYVVGDRIDAEIQFGNELGLKTVRLQYGRYKDMMPQHTLQEAHHTITEFSQLGELLK